MRLDSSLAADLTGEGVRKRDRVCGEVKSVRYGGQTQYFEDAKEDGNAHAMNKIFIRGSSDKRRAAPSWPMLRQEPLVGVKATHTKSIIHRIKDVMAAKCPRLKSYRVPLSTRAERLGFKRSDTKLMLDVSCEAVP
eukprot:1101812-Amphidinium_carterae.1